MKHWSEQDHIEVYHGTHVNNIPKIQQNGIANKDPDTGMISVAIGHHGKNISRAYAAMSGSGGESKFRKPGSKAVNVPNEDRAVVVMRLPREWVDKHVDRNFGGNSPAVKERLSDINKHNEYVAKHGEDFAWNETPELRFKEQIPAKYITRVITGKENAMKTFREFVEDLAEEVPINSASGEGNASGKAVSFYDKLLRFIKRRPPKDNFNHPETTKDMTKSSSVGIAGLP